MGQIWDRTPSPLRTAARVADRVRYILAYTIHVATWCALGMLLASGLGIWAFNNTNAASWAAQPGTIGNAAGVSGDLLGLAVIAAVIALLGTTMGLLHAPRRASQHHAGSHQW